MLKHRRAAVAATLLLALGCQTKAPPSAETATPTAAPAPPQTLDPWVTPPPSPDDPPSDVDNRRRADAMCASVTRAPFFQVEKNGKVNYILGSRHAGVSLAKQPPIVEAKVRSASTVVLETAPDDEADFPEDKSSVPELLGPELWQRYRKLVGPRRADALARKGVLMAHFLMLGMYEDTSQGLDSDIETLAVSLKKATAGLEAEQLQVDLMVSLLDARALRVAVQTSDRNSMQHDTETDVRDYCTGVEKAPGIDAKDRKDMLAAGYSDAEINQIEDKMVFQRNRNWIPKLEQLFAASDVFVVVGADHLPGDKGVLALLTKRGFNVTRVEATAQ
ncbi:MAG TPA: TraB/GumN family protein [Kofleriaceae bacterium]|nr:TraB/GumN family protein [Kofleriaceae bacterium]